MMMSNKKQQACQHNRLIREIVNGSKTELADNEEIELVVALGPKVSQFYIDKVKENKQMQATNEQKQDYNYRVRYSFKNNGQRRGVLTTYQVANLVYFGLSKCCKKDKFNKKIGIDIAVGRMEKAMLTEGNTEFDCKQRTLQHTRSGYVRVENVKNLLRYFRKYTRG